MVSHRRRKKEAERRGLNEPELEMVELLDEVLERFRWLQVLSWAQSYLLREKLKIRDEELDRVLEAATRAVDKDGTWKRWQEGLGRLKGELVESRRALRRERKGMAREQKGPGRQERSRGEQPETGSEAEATGGAEA